MAPIKTIGVVSTGVIGSSFIALCLSRGFRVLVCSPSGNPASAAKLEAYLAELWPTLDPAALAPGASPANWQHTGASLAGHYDAVDLVQENGPEDAALKGALLGALDARLPRGVPVCSSTSGIVASVLAARCARHPERVLVAHPFNPPHLVPLVEVVPHPGTDAGVCERVLAFYRALGRRPVLVRKETPGFVANRLQAVLLEEAFSLVLNGVATAEEVDLCITHGPGLRWPFVGPFMGLVLAGGGGKDGFKHVLNHISPSSQVWLDDCHAKAHRINGNQEKIGKMDESVQEMLKGLDTTEVRKKLGQSLTQLLKAKEESQGSP